MRLLLISLGVTCLCTIAIFLYFRNRISRMEQKVELMFQLIQEYEQNKIIQNHSPEHQIPYTNPPEDIPEVNLINVSDDDYSDSDEVSDNEEALSIDNTIVTENIKSISLSGAEIKLVESDDLDDVSDIEEEVITLEEVKNDKVEPEISTVADDEVDEDDEVLNNISDEIVEKPLGKRSVKELKQLAENKGFTNYKGLRKDKLVELLSEHQ